MALRNWAWILLTLQSSLALGQELQWFRQFGCPVENSVGRNLTVTAWSDGGLMGFGQIGGTSYDFDGNTVTVSGFSDVVVLKLDGDGAAQWAQAAGGACAEVDPWDDFPRRAITDTSDNLFVVVGDYSGNAVVGGFTLVGDCGDRNMFIAVFDGNGDAIWAKRVTGMNVLNHALVEGGDDNYHLFGTIADWPATFHATNSVTLTTGGFRAIYDADGELVSAEHLLNTGEVVDASPRGSDFILCGNFLDQDTIFGVPLEPTAPYKSGFLCKTNGQDAIDWIVQCSSSSKAVFTDCLALPDGDIAAAGYFIADVVIEEDTLFTTAAPPGGRFIAKFSPAGSLKWIKNLSSLGSYGIYSLSAGMDGGIYIHGECHHTLTIGNISLPSTTSSDQFVVSVDSLGIWDGALFLGRSALSSTVGLVISEDGIVVSGGFDSTMVIGTESFEPTNAGWPDLFVAKFDGLLPVSGVQSLGLQDNELHIYANPNNGVCTIDLPDAIKPGSELRLRIFDNMGQLVQDTPISMNAQGLVGLDIQAQAKGVYHVELVDAVQRYAGTIVFE